jgi:hypothetical protein
LGLGKDEPGYHLNCNPQFGDGDETGAEIGFEARGEDEKKAKSQTLPTASTELAFQKH